MPSRELGAFALIYRLLFFADNGKLSFSSARFDPRQNCAVNKSAIRARFLKYFNWPFNTCNYPPRMYRRNPKFRAFDKKMRRF